MISKQSMYHQKNNISDYLRQNTTSNTKVEVNALETQVNQIINYVMPIALPLMILKKEQLATQFYLKLSK